MKVRRAEEKDLGRINDLLLQVDLVHHEGRPDLFKIGKKYTDEQLRMILSNEETPVFVAVDEEDYVRGYAFCILKQFVNDDILTDIRTIYIDDLCVDEQFRMQHVGETLYEAVLRYAREGRFYNVTLNVWTCNEGAMKFYEKCGLLPQKITMEKVLAAQEPV